MHTRPVHWLAVLLAIMAAAPARAGAQTAAASDAPALTVRTSIKAGAIGSRDAAQSLWRLRFEPEVNTGPHAAFSAAYEQRFRYTSTPTGITTMGVLPADTAAPYRIRQLDWGLSESASGSWRHEIDRANARVHTGRAEFTIGRQAIGWGRGVMFGAVDLFAPFSPLEADREWRRGIDAARADIKLGDRSSVDVVTAFGTTWDRSLAAARVRGYAGHADVEAMAGRRARDLFAGFTTSAAVGDAELHGELASFKTPAETIWKAVAGGSFRVPVGSGVLVYGEYHYSGFGARNPADLARLLSDPGFVERYVRGDTQILSRHAIGVLASYEASPELALTAQWLHMPLDHSGVVAPGMTWTFSDRVSMLGAGYAAYGNRSLAGFAQLRVYL